MINKSDNHIAALLKEQRNLFHTRDLRLLWNIKNESTLHNTISRYIKKGIFIPLYRGFYATVSLDKIDPFELGTCAIHNYSYISTETVLALEGIIFQNPTSYTFCSTKNQKIEIKTYSYLVRQLEDKYLYSTAGIVFKPGYKIATTERAVADMLYFNPKYYFDARDRIDWKRVEQIKKEVGYL